MDRFIRHPLIQTVISPQFRGIAVVLFVVGFIADTVTTISLIDHPGLYETNPLVAGAVAIGGLWGMVALKLGLTAIVIGWFYYLWTDEMFDWWANTTLFGCGALWTIAGIWNLSLLG